MRDSQDTTELPSADGQFLLDMQDQSSGPEPHAGPRSRGRALAVVGALLAALMLFGGGWWAGAAAVDPTQSEQYQGMRDSRDRQIEQNSELRGENDAIGEELAELKGGLEARESELAEREEALGERETSVGEAEAAVAKREESVTSAEEEKASNTVGEGTWTVGVDIAAGTYRSEDSVGSRCYWGIYRTGTNGSDIIENDIPGGGRPTVTLSAGQDFTSRRCGTWIKQ